MSLPTLEQRLACRALPLEVAVGRMRWEKLLFLHWAWDASVVQSMLPAGLQVDTFNGNAWVGVVPLLMQRVHPVGLPCVPWLSDFLELNVRTYVHDGKGTSGVWFFSLVCNQPVAVHVARACFHLNYVSARMKVSFSATEVEYASRRDGVESRYRYAPGAAFQEARPGSLEFFVLERYVLFSADKKGRLHAGRVKHAPYQAGAVEVLEQSFTPAVQDGFSQPARLADHAIYSPRVDVSVGPLKLHR